MNLEKQNIIFRLLKVALIFLFFMRGSLLYAGDLDSIQKRQVLRHLGIPYANFVTDSGLGLDVEMMNLFARHLGVKYELVITSWSDAFGDLNGKMVNVDGDEIVLTGETKIRGDVLANGLTILPWRQKIVDFSTPTFPTGVWLVARADSSLKPILPSGDIETDIEETKKLLKGHTVLSMKGTCLDSDLYSLEETGAKILLHTTSESLNDIAPAILEGRAETTILDIPDALVALQKWPGEIKIIGPISKQQLMAVAFPKSSPELKAAFNDFFDKIWRDGTYEQLVKKYYPSVFFYMGDYFSSISKN